jgi:hypothetical protein
MITFSQKNICISIIGGINRLGGLGKILNAQTVKKTGNRFWDVCVWYLAQKSSQLILEYYLHWTIAFEILYLFQLFRHKPRQLQLIVEYDLHWTTAFEISFQVVQHKPRQLIVEYYLHWTITSHRLRYLFQVVQTQTKTAYCRILPTLNHHVWDIFSR